MQSASILRLCVYRWSVDAHSFFATPGLLALLVLSEQMIEMVGEFVAIALA